MNCHCPHANQTSQTNNDYMTMLQSRLSYGQNQTSPNQSPLMPNPNMAQTAPMLCYCRFVGQRTFDGSMK